MPVVTMKDLESRPGGGVPYASAEASGVPIPGQPVYSSTTTDPPVGTWRDGLFDFFRNIVPSCLLSWAFPCIPLGQIANKLGTSRWLTYKTIVGSYCVAYLIWFIVAAATHPGKAQSQGLQTMSILMFLGLFAAAYALRGAVRNRYSIPGSNAEDCVSSFFCNCCVASQMLRHLVPYRGAFDDCNMSSNV